VAHRPAAATTLPSATPTTTLAKAGAAAISTAVAPSTTATWQPTGSWTVGAGSQAGYSLDDTAFGQTNRVVARTKQVTGSMTIVGSTLTTTRITVDMASVMCHCVHDSKYRQFLETDKYPNSVFELTVPISLTTVPAPNQIITVPINRQLHHPRRDSLSDVHAEGHPHRRSHRTERQPPDTDVGLQHSPTQRRSFGGVSNCDIDLLIAFDRAALAPTRSAVDP